MTAIEGVFVRSAVVAATGLRLRFVFSSVAILSGGSRGLGEEEFIMSSLRVSCTRESESCIFLSSCNSPSIGVFCAACAMVREE